MDFTSSRAAQGYNPQFLNTDTVPGAPAASTSGSPDLTNRLLQIMSGQLGGTLTGGEKLSALGALLKSVSRGSQTSPQQVMQSIQQQKLQEVQGALQIQELRKAAAEKAQREGFITQASSRITDPAEKDFFMSLTDKGKEEYLIKKMAPRDYGPTPEERQAVSLGLKPGSDAFTAYITQGYGRDQYIQTPQGTARIPGVGVSYRNYVDPDTGEEKSLIVIGGKAYQI